MVACEGQFSYQHFSSLHYRNDVFYQMGKKVRMCVNVNVHISKIITKQNTKDVPAAG